jgi:hypothetical protein
MTALGLALSACSHAADSSAAPGQGTDKPAVAVAIPGTDEKKITLTADAARRVGIETAAVRRVAATGGGQDVIPVSAVYYDGTGGTWVYTSPAPLQYVRASVRLGPITGDTVVLEQGPAAGTLVVSVGEAELYGVEYGVGGEQ